VNVSYTCFPSLNSTAIGAFRTLLCYLPQCYLLIWLSVSSVSFLVADHGFVIDFTARRHIVVHLFLDHFLDLFHNSVVYYIFNPVVHQ
jgi:hypothetical protein